MNPLLDFSGLPRFHAITAAYIAPAIDQLLTENRTLIAELSDSASVPTWPTFVQPIVDANERLSRAWGVVSHLNNVMNNAELRTAYNENLPKITQYSAALAQNQALYRGFRELRNGSEFSTLTMAQQKIIDNGVLDFRLGGAELNDDDKLRFLQLQENLAQLGAKFEENLLDATNAFNQLVESVEDLRGLPDDVLQVAREAAQGQGKNGWTFTLHAPSYMPVMQYADNRALRETMYRAYVTRASEFGPADLDNTDLIENMVALRHESALLLGFNNYVELSLENKMAESPEQVDRFLRDLARRAKPSAERDRQQLQQFAAEQLQLPDLQAWDLAYASEKLRLSRYDFSDQEVKQYFPEPQVLSGMFQLVRTLYGLDIRRGKAEVWHNQVEFYDIYDGDNALIGQFYLDLYAREHKRGGAWMDDALTRRRKPDGIQTPVAYLTCNFSAPVGDKPALFTHDEVITLFHEFGHGLHHLLTQVEELGVSGINGVEWDAVELPSQFMENFCWEWEVLRHMTQHVERQSALPRELYDKMTAARQFQSGLQTLRQVEFALFDLQLHAPRFKGDMTALKLLTAIRQEIAVLIPPAYNRFPNNFSHIFAGGYAAGYYSYQWAEVLSADAYSLFEDNGILSPETGDRFRREILAVGGARSAYDSFVAFRGREPQIDALLRHNGMN